jgi:cytochrome c556
MTRAISFSVGAAVMMLTLMPSVLAHEHATDIVKERMDGMAAMAKSMKSIAQRIKAGHNLAAIRADAEAMQPLTSKFAEWFPQGSNPHPSEARVAIWQNWSDFESKGHALAREVSKLVTIDTGNSATVAAQVRSVNQACGACHELYREKKR